ncbi:hypothetical protein OPKNFCMD_4761 [Methylobacterium crusticola]|uniref:ABC transporter permease n=2 Tax=Methylobacterium crusticola TaxID=1697972 RepID=A0ABQ4R4Y0_9HYPH|nr:hypothetical protein OPKNFCMD_4761 [Methylobacterium crusticola]
MTLYEAAFAALARIGGAGARRPVAQVTLFGGLASSVLWPVGEAPADAVLAARLYALAAAAASVLNAALSAHMIPILIGLGVAPALAVWIGSVRGVGQTGARLGEVLFGRRMSPLALGLLAALVLPVAFALGFLAGVSTPAGLAFAFLYGAGNGLLTIVRGTVPLVLFEPAAYGTLVGRLLAPSFLLSAAAPLAYAVVIARLGDAAALALSLGLAALVVVASALLWLRFGRGAPGLAALEAP